MVLEQQHRAGPLKQQNKKHKTGRHRSKGAIDVFKKGRDNVLKHSRKRKLELSREERRNQANQLRKKKREEFLEKRRGILEAPFLVALLPLNSNIDCQGVIESFKKADSDAVISETPEGHVHLNIPRWKQRFTFVTCEGDNLFDVLDPLKIASTVVLLASSDGISDEGEVILSACIAQGFPSSVALITDLASVPLKKRQEYKNQVQKELSRWTPEEKVMGLEKDSDALTVLRKIGNQKIKSILCRDIRPHMIAENVEFIETEPGKGRVSLSGYLRGETLDVNSLVHIPGWGDFQMSSIEAGPNSEHLTLLATADPAKQVSLVSENEPDPMDAEQTWPTKEEIEEAEASHKKLVKKVPKGFSEYQAAWIPDEDAFELDESDEENLDEDMDPDLMEEDDESSEYEDAESMFDDTETTASEIPAEKYDKAIDLEQEKKDMEETLKRAQEDKEFPDEVDTPLDIPARERFQKYRGLLSFRTTPWDPKENLPQDYARIFQFKNFLRTKKHVLKNMEEINGAQPGCFVRVHIEKVPTYLVNLKEKKQPIVLYGMLQHEQKMSVVNVVLKRPPNEQLPLKSKETLLFQCGYRRFKAAPIYSQHKNASKFKYERFFQPDSIAVATMYAPIMFPPCSVLAFKENADGSLTLVATGSFHSVNPDRLVIKRVVLSGHVFKIHKKSAVVRFMFFNREDISWFKPIELKTKYGQRGHIKQPLGTHGHMKCVFNSQLKSQDTVLMCLYKRMFPKWSYNPFVSLTQVMAPVKIEGMEEECTENV